MKKDRVLLVKHVRNEFEAILEEVTSKVVRTYIVVVPLLQPIQLLLRIRRQSAEPRKLTPEEFGQLAQHLLRVFPALACLGARQSVGLDQGGQK